MIYNDDSGMEDVFSVRCLLFLHMDANEDHVLVHLNDSGAVYEVE